MEVEGILALFIPIIAILASVALPLVVAWVLIFKKINSTHKERMGMIQQGIIPPNEPKRKSTPNRYRSLRNGVILVALGIGVIVGFVSANNLNVGDNEFWIISASIIFFLGLGYLTFFLITRNSVREMSDSYDSDLEDDVE